MYSTVGMQVQVLPLLAVVVPFAPARLAVEMLGGSAYCSISFWNLSVTLSLSRRTGR